MTSHHECNHYRARWMLFKHLVSELLVFSLTLMKSRTLLQRNQTFLYTQPDSGKHI
jgi:hypothetical protein